MEASLCKDGHELAYEPKFRPSLSWLGVQELMFGEDTFLEHLPGFWPVWQYGASHLNLTCYLTLVR